MKNKNKIKTLLLALISVFLSYSISFKAYAAPTETEKMPLKPTVATGEAKKFSDAADLAKTIDQKFKQETTELKAAMNDLAQDEYDKSSKEQEKANHLKKKILAQKRLDKQNLYASRPKLADLALRRQVKKLAQVRLGMKRSEIISQFKAGEEDVPSDLEKLSFKLVARDAFSDIPFVTFPDGGKVEVSSTFYFTDDQKLKKISVAVPTSSQSVETWIVE